MTKDQMRSALISHGVTEPDHGVDLSALDDDALFAKLKEHGISPGPIVGSTRKFYQKKLVLMLKGETATTTNGNGAEYSDTEEEEEEDDQPSAVTSLVQPSVTTRR